MNSSWTPPWVRYAPPAAQPWAGLPAVQRRYLSLICVPLGLLAAAIVASTSAAHRGIVVLDIAVAILATALVPLLWTRYQVPAAIVLAGLAALSPAATPASTAMAIIVARLRAPRVAILVAAAGLAGHLVQGLWRVIPLPFGWYALCAAAIYAALTGWGGWGRTRTELLRSLHERAVRAEREQAMRLRHAKLDERSRIAREMHDTLAHHLTLITTTAGALEYRPDADPAAIQASAGRVREVASEALIELRAILRVLRTDDDDLRPAPGLAEIPALVEQARADGVRLRWETSGEAEPPPAVGLAAYRVIQEALTNARRHAPGGEVEVTLLSSPQHLDLTVTNGPAASAAVDGEGSGTGLMGLAERVELLGGTLTAGPQPDGGFSVVASIPWQPWTRSGSS